MSMSKQVIFFVDNNRVDDVEKPSWVAVLIRKDDSLLSRCVYEITSRRRTMFGTKVWKLLRTSMEESIGFNSLRKTQALEMSQRWKSCLTESV